ncbi:hypothetical protein B0O80DRAFT_420707 [Mortierella sp. GBAus27b]|nr:hypothetical protein B0O80DRAFT_420707 [Mortierella sp. GBAus27b]
MPQAIMPSNQAIGIRRKTMTLSIPTIGHGPNGEPLFIGAIGAPARINGSLTFDCGYECKGNYITIEYIAMAEAKWTSQGHDETLHNRGHHAYERQMVQMVLPHPKPGVIQAGQYSCPFDFSVDPSTPSSFSGPYAWMTYSVKATLVRSFPSTNMVQEQVIWVLNSILPRPERPLADAPVAMVRHDGNLNYAVRYLCLIPSSLLYLNQDVPVTIKILPSSVSVHVMSAVVKLKQYTKLVVRSEKKSETKEVFSIPLKDGWPAPEANNSWQRTMVVPLPGSPVTTSSISSPLITITHVLKLIIQVRLLPRKEMRELRVECKPYRTRFVCQSNQLVFRRCSNPDIRFYLE